MWRADTGRSGAAETMGGLDVMTTLLVRLLGVDPLNVPGPVLLLGFTTLVLWTTALVWLAWTLLRLVFAGASDRFEVARLTQHVVIARGLTRHDFEQVRKAVRGWRLLVLRHGSDDYLRDMAGEADRHAGRMRREVIAMRLGLSAIGEVTLSWSLPVHRRIGTQFRCFAELRPGDAGQDILSGMLRHYDAIEVLPAEVPHPTRVYFLLNRFRVRLASDGAKHNFALPE